MTASAFKDLNWKDVGSLMGAHVSEVRGSEVRLYIPPKPNGDGTYAGSRELIVSDNGGEVNVHEVVVALPDSIALPNSHYKWKEGAMATRLFQALAGHPIDYDFGERETP